MYNLFTDDIDTRQLMTRLNEVNKSKTIKTRYYNHLFFEVEKIKNHLSKFLVGFDVKFLIKFWFRWQRVFCQEKMLYGHQTFIIPHHQMLLKKIWRHRILEKKLFARKIFQFRIRWNFQRRSTIFFCLEKLKQISFVSLKKENFSSIFSNKRKFSKNYTKFVFQNWILKMIMTTKNHWSSTKIRITK